MYFHVGRREACSMLAPVPRTDDLPGHRPPHGAIRPQSGVPHGDQEVGWILGEILRTNEVQNGAFDRLSSVAVGVNEFFEA